MSDTVYRPATDLSELVFGRLERLTVCSTQATQITQAETVDEFEKEVVDPTRLTQAVDRLFGSMKPQASNKPVPSHALLLSCVSGFRMRAVTA